LLCSENIGDCLIAKTKMDNLKKKSLVDKSITVNSETNKSWSTRFNKSNDMKEDVIKEDELFFAEHEERMKNWKGNSY
jgi:hypothetical protein